MGFVSYRKGGMGEVAIDYTCCYVGVQFLVIV
jgi:hypothetical protein